ncbi:glucan endo-1 3-beta-d-glucosidase [Phtheirospermum japonicum]|uniref:Glucan endo-1 3-beta-d-glucosidase n=1 Tax=Phtheirospermum japonicum TaxID=374723 RepID=A0A830BP69_9LAMI|nr:glucan endo-1 3-beta-d-glucosidase [Phtheirospermum japonicum]
MIKVSAPYNKLQGYIDHACGKYDCKEIKPGGSCYEPQKLESYASYALDLEYRATGTCNPEFGTTTVTDPSYGSCKYP